MDNKMSNQFSELICALEEMAGRDGDLAKRVRNVVEEIEKARLAAETVSRAKSEFLAGMFHEIRTPLNSILGFSDLLFEGLAGPVNDAQKEYLNVMMESGKYLLSLVNDILDLSKIEAGKMDLEPGEVSIRDLLETSLAIFRERALKHDIKTRLVVEEGIGTIIGDERKIRQVVFNLLSNAFKFTPDGGSVHVLARRETRDLGSSDFIEISVEDTGPGIPEEERKMLFLPFEQLTTSRLNKSEGTGLGLSLARRMVELHGGTIRAEFGLTEPDKAGGSKFIFTLPVGAFLRR